MNENAKTNFKLKFNKINYALCPVRDKILVDKKSVMKNKSL